MCNESDVTDVAVECCCPLVVVGCHRHFPGGSDARPCRPPPRACACSPSRPCCWAWCSAWWCSASPAAPAVTTTPPPSWPRARRTTSPSRDRHPTPTTPGVATNFRMSSLNALGADHTDARRQQARLGVRRAADEVADQGDPQDGRRRDRAAGVPAPAVPGVRWRELGDRVRHLPGDAWGKKGMRNSVAWRLDTVAARERQLDQDALLPRHHPADAGRAAAQRPDRPADLLLVVPQPGGRAGQRRQVARAGDRPRGRRWSTGCAPSAGCRSTSPAT